MKSSILISLVLIFSTQAKAHDGWLCTEEASQIRNGAIEACGIGEATSEALARTEAFKQASMEFKRICNESDDCRDRQVQAAVPKRTQCDQSATGFKCYRLIVYNMGEVILRKASEFKSEFKTKLSLTEKQIRARIYKGMNKQDFLKFAGLPDRVEGSGGGLKFWRYFGASFCEKKLDLGYCSIYFDGDKLFDYHDVNAKFIDTSKEI